jgi:molybdopterin synthase sulfur carrier subunit
MAQVVFTDNLCRHIKCEPVDVDAASVREALEAVFCLRPEVRGYVLDDQGRLRRHVMVFVNGEVVADRLELSDLIDQGAEIYVMQALSGG